MDAIYNRMADGENYAVNDGRVFEMWKNSPELEIELEGIKRIRDANCKI